MKSSKVYISLAFIVTLTLGACKDYESFDNKVYTNSSKVTTLLMKNSVTNYQKTLQAAIAMPAESDVNVIYKVDEALVATYNEAYYDKAIMLPTECYDLPINKVTINKGSVRSNEIVIDFKNINKLDRNQLYVLPVTVAESNIPVLESAKNTYYVFKGAALINVVADIDENNLHIDKWANPSVVNNLSQLTMEALIKVRNYDRMISTLMGIEGKFLIRLGDAGFPNNQIQVATHAGNFPSADSNKGLPVGEWVHVAVTYDSSNGNLKIYVNGKLQSEGTKRAGAVNLGINGVDGFYVGRSYADERYLAGEISECRIWNVVRTQDEILNNPYEVIPSTPGLVAYWKCNEGGGSVVKDCTGNGNDLIAKNNLKWNPVVLPVPSN